MTATQPKNLAEKLREAVKELPIIPTDKFLQRVEEKISEREKHAGDEAYVIAAKKVREQQLERRQLATTMLELLAAEKPKRGRPAKAATSGAVVNTEQSKTIAQSSDSTPSEEPGVWGGK